MALKIVEREVIKDDAITAAKVEDGTVVTADLTTNFITNAHVKSDAAIAASKITGLATSATTDTTDADNIASGTLPTARLDTGTTANKIVVLDGNAKLPAISGANLTGVESATVSTSDPVITTNPSGGVGTKWINKTSGEVYVCTDATAGENVWKNVGAGSDNIEPYSFQGSNYGFRLGGYAAATNTMSRWSLTSAGNSADWADLFTTNFNPFSAKSSDYGFCMGGRTAAPETYLNNITKFPFATQTNATDVADTTQARGMGASASSSSYGYMAGGFYNPGSAYYNIIDKFPYASASNSTDVGDLTKVWVSCGSANSDTYGYAMGGATTGFAKHVDVDKWSLTSDANASDVGNLTTAHYYGAGCSSTTHGYAVAGRDTPGNEIHTIDKISFASDGNGVLYSGSVASDSGKHSGGVGGVSSTTHGYCIGGGNNSGNMSNIIDKFSYASEGNATDVGDLETSTNNQYIGATQY